MCHTDTAGNVTFESLWPLYYKDAEIAIMGFDITNRNTFEECNRRIGLVKEQGPPTITIVAVGNKIDLDESRKVSAEEARAHFDSMGIPYFETSAKTGQAVREMLEETLRLWRVMHPDASRNVNESAGSNARQEKCAVQ